MLEPIVCSMEPPCPGDLSKPWLVSIRHVWHPKSCPGPQIRLALEHPFAHNWHIRLHSCVFSQISPQGSRKMGTVGTCSQPIWDLSSHFWLASWNSFRNKCPSQNELPEMENASQIGLKAQQRCIRTTVMGINSLKTTNICFFLIILETAHGSHFWSVPSQFYIFWIPGSPFLRG